jgi:hypothetical protein
VAEAAMVLMLRFLRLKGRLYNDSSCKFTRRRFH